MKKGGRGNMKIKKNISILLIVVMVLSFSACGKITEKIAEKGIEKLIEDKTGAEVDINKDGASISVDGGSMQTGEDLDWPKEAMGELPEPKAKVTFMMLNDENKGGSVTLTDFDEDKAKKYVEDLKDLGFTEVMNMADAESIVFVGTSDKGEQINFSYDIESKEGVIIYGLGQ
jgi:hypothetical protein